MAVSYTTTQLIASIKRRASMPTSQQLFTDQAFIDLATDEMESNIVPMIMSVREEYFVKEIDYTITASQIAYAIPPRAIGMKLRDVVLVTNPNTPQYSISSLPRLNLEDISNDVGSPYITPVGFYLKNNDVILYPTPANTGTYLRLYYLERPLTLCTTSNAGQITSINTGTNEVTLSFVPNDWVVGDTINAVSSVPGFQTTVVSAEITALSDPTVTLDSVDDLSVGDWISLEGFSPIPQIPVEAQIVLAQATAVKCLEALGDREGMAAAERKLEQNKHDMLTMLNPRVDGAIQKVTNAGTGIFMYGRYINRTVW
jgi:hypothetical protein